MADQNIIPADQNVILTFEPTLNRFGFHRTELSSKALEPMVIQNHGYLENSGKNRNIEIFLENIGNSWPKPLSSSPPDLAASIGIKIPESDLSRPVS